MAKRDIQWARKQHTESLTSSYCLALGQQLLGPAPNYNSFKPCSYFGTDVNARRRYYTTDIVGGSIRGSFRCIIMERPLFPPRSVPFFGCLAWHILHHSHDNGCRWLWWTKTSQVWRVLAKEVHLVGGFWHWCFSFRVWCLFFELIKIKVRVMV